MSKAISIHAFVIAALFAAAANAADSSESWAPWPFHHEEPAGKPDRVVVYWNDAVATDARQPAIRGFGGRMMFYESKSDVPVKIDGTLIIYAFDETNRDPNNSKPDCKYVFTPEQLPKHHSMSKVGHSYSVWLPWDQAGGMQKEITLIVRFEPKLGAGDRRPIEGDTARHTAAVQGGLGEPFAADWRRDASRTGRPNHERRVWQSGTRGRREWRESAGVLWAAGASRGRRPRGIVRAARPTVRRTRGPGNSRAADGDRHD